MNEDAKKFGEAIGVMAEMTLLFYRAAINAGALRSEAMALTSAYLDALVKGAGNVKGNIRDDGGKK